MLSAILNSLITSISRKRLRDAHEFRDSCSIPGAWPLTPTPSASFPPPHKRVKFTHKCVLHYDPHASYVEDPDEMSVSYENPTVIGGQSASPEADVDEHYYKNGGHINELTQEETRQRNRYPSLGKTILTDPTVRPILKSRTEPFPVTEVSPISQAATAAGLERARRKRSHYDLRDPELLRTEAENQLIEEENQPINVTIRKEQRINQERIEEEKQRITAKSQCKEVMIQEQEKVPQELLEAKSRREEAVILERQRRRIEAARKDAVAEHRRRQRAAAAAAAAAPTDPPLPKDIQRFETFIQEHSRNILRYSPDLYEEYRKLKPLAAIASRRLTLETAEKKLQTILENTRNRNPHAMQIIEAMENDVAEAQNALDHEIVNHETLTKQVDQTDDSSMADSSNEVALEVDDSMDAANLQLLETLQTSDDDKTTPSTETTPDVEPSLNAEPTHTSKHSITTDLTEYNVIDQHVQSALAARQGSGQSDSGPPSDCSQDNSHVHRVDAAVSNGWDQSMIKSVPSNLQDAVPISSRVDVAIPNCRDHKESETPRKLRSSRSRSLSATLSIPMEDLNLGNASARRKSGRTSIAKEKAQAKQRRRAESDARKKAELARQQAEQATKEEEERRKAGVLRTPREDVISPMSEEWERRVAHTMGPGGVRTKIECEGNITLTRADLDRVLPQPGQSAWLNDDIINAYLNSVVTAGQKERHQRRNHAPKLSTLSSFWYPKIVKDGPESIARWTRKAGINGTKLLAVERLFIPINMNNMHWTLCVVSPTAKRIDYFDSLGGSGDAVIQNIMEWIGMELPHENLRQWRTSQHSEPHQTNGSDCGVFVLTTSLMIMRGIDPLAYKAKHIPIQRRRIVGEFLNGGLFESFYSFE